jgi:hypothetical protein
MLQCGAPGCAKGWHRQFDDPLELPDGRVLVTLHDAATYITELAEKGVRGARVADRHL